MKRQLSDNLAGFYSRGLLLLFIVTGLLLTSCKDDPETLPEPAFEFETSGVLEFGIPLEVKFADKSSGTDGATQYAWDFGDGATSTEKNPDHTYDKGGVYPVKLKVTNGGSSREITREVSLSSPLAGTWVLDSLAVSTIDSFATKDIRTAIEFGNGAGWDGQKWTDVSDDGYSTFWSNTIFKGSYLGRTAFFEVEYKFTADGQYIRDEKGKLPAAVYWPEERDFAETEDWLNTEGVSLNAWKSGEFNWQMKASTEYPGRTDLVIDGNKGGFLGLYFLGSPLQVPDDVYTYTIAAVNDNQLVVSGVSNLFGDPNNVFVLKFKRINP